MYDGCRLEVCKKIVVDPPGFLHDWRSTTMLCTACTLNFLSSRALLSRLSPSTACTQCTLILSYVLAGASRHSSSAYCLNCERESSFGTMIKDAPLLYLSDTTSTSTCLSCCIITLMSDPFHISSHLVRADIPITIWVILYSRHTSTI